MESEPRGRRPLDTECAMREQVALGDAWNVLCEDDCVSQDRLSMSLRSAYTNIFLAILVTSCVM